MRRDLGKFLRRDKPEDMAGVADGESEQGSNRPGNECAVRTFNTHLR